jgi:site-specific recombinase XerD
MKNSNLFFSLTWAFLNEYLTKQVGRSPATIASYRDSLSIFRHYLTNTKHMSIAKFSFLDCNRDCMFGFRDYLAQRGCKPSTINVRVAAIRAYLFYAADKDVAVQSIALAVAEMPKRKTIQEEKPLLSINALAAILAAPPQTKRGLLGGSGGGLRTAKSAWLTVNSSATQRVKTASP